MSSVAYKLPKEADHAAESKMPLVRPRAIKPKKTTAPTLQREMEAISPFAVVGFLAACALVVLVLLAHIQLDVVNNETAALSNQLNQLESEYEDLSAQYEQLFDMDSIKNDLIASGAMIQVTQEQQIYMDMSRPDSSTVYEDNEETNTTLLAKLAASFSDIFSN